MPNSVSSSAAGSVMVMGEHAVLQGYPAIVAAVDQRITVQFAKRNDNHITIHSETLGDYQTQLDTIAIVPPFQFVLAVIKHYQSQLKSGFDLRITSDFSHRIGLGSSAAVTAATVAVLDRHLQYHSNKQELAKLAIACVRKVQGLASGADVVASIFGGMAYYRAQPFYVEHNHALPDISLIYSGHKVPTAEVIAQLAVAARQRPDDYRHYYHDIGQQVQQAWQSIQAQDWRRLAGCFREQQKIMQQLGVSNQTLEMIIEDTLAVEGILAAKISGSGLGDCVIALGKLKDHFFPRNASQQQLGIQQVQAILSHEGLSNA